MRSSVSLAVARSHAGSAATADQAAVVAVVAGDTARFGELYSRHYAPVRNYARSMLGDEAEAEDIAQETFILALRALPRYEDRGLPFRAWLIRIAHNTALGHLRRHNRVLALPPLELSYAVERGRPRDPESLTDGELEACMRRLPLAQRQVLVLRLIFGFSGVEAAVILGRTEAGVRQIHHRALKNLRRAFAGPPSTVGNSPSRLPRRAHSPSTP